MSRISRSKKQVDVHLRIRPLVKEELERDDAPLVLRQVVNDGLTSLELTTPKTDADDVEFVEVLGFTVPKSKPNREKSFKRFKSVHQDVSNVDFFAATVAPLVSDMLAGRTACCFAYGHTGSGKTHTILGYESELGMYELASKRLFDALEVLHAHHDQPHSGQDRLKLQIRFNEMYNGEVYDLLNDGAQCFVREDAHGKVHIRGETLVDAETGLVSTPASTSLVASSHDELLGIVRRGMAGRATGNSNVHRASSRSHAILELEFVSDRVLALRETIAGFESAYNRIRHERDTLEMDIFNRQHYKVEGKYVMKPNAQGSTDDEREKLLALKNQYKLLDGRKRAAEREAQRAGLPGLGGTLVFVDLAGSEHASKVSDGIQKTEEEQQECREINKSLSALRACFRAQTQGLKSTVSCYRESKLTLLLRDHLRTAEASRTTMIATISPSSFHATKTIHTLQYAQLVAEK
ncbi:Aste57867_17189 [Aphanomyces stellatus]|uniref:Kinesin-like protein n=1 Tax=Aphanomyces stellatus TaxID=120398 RepID=A0A485L841_9STRA|nr:hypothetical protein As57867_017130 [Aphanomyces stellatus]VFT93946.1 Aste57867_17189 [Aphanomyces stellatus]